MQGPAFTSEKYLKSINASYEYIDLLVSTQMASYWLAFWKNGVWTKSIEVLLVMQECNLKIKYRESFRPSVLREKVNEWFELDSPYMLLVAPVKKEKLKKMSDEKLFQEVTHIDYSARIQTVHKETNERYHI